MGAQRLGSRRPILILYRLRKLCGLAKRCRDAPIEAGSDPEDSRPLGSLYSAALFE
jgi:hypothetical protein